MELVAKNLNSFFHFSKLVTRIFSYLVYSSNVILNLYHYFSFSFSFSFSLSPLLSLSLSLSLSHTHTHILHNIST